MLEETVDERVDLYFGELHPDDRQVEELAESLRLLTGEEIPAGEAGELSSSEEASVHIIKKLRSSYEEREKILGGEVMRGLERAVMLQVIDTKWKEHLLTMDHLREGIHLRAYGQKDPVVEYQQEGFVLFRELVKSIRESIVEFMFKARVSGEPPAEMHRGFSGREEFSEKEQFAGVPAGSSQGGRAPRAKLQPVRRAEGKVGRNEPCPCGSGKKYKKCCGGSS
jgi:preprotein translocase subunit SecA